MANKLAPRPLLAKHNKAVLAAGSKSFLLLFFKKEKILPF
jgi:hypothetical protein